MVFKCSYKNNKKLERWTGEIIKLKSYGSHYEMKINSRSGITVLFGETSIGNFACMSDFKAGCPLAELDNEFYNTGKLISVMNIIDGITVAKALKIISKKFKGDSKCI